jgi:RecB family exonuclease
MTWQNFQGMSIPLSQSTNRKRRYSVTADIHAFERCSIQYGAFAARKYEPALAVQRFYGTVIHQVLDRAHAHYRGLIGPQQPGSLPTNTDIESYFLDVENSLHARRIRAVAHIRDQALEVLKRFNNLEGQALYPRVIDTECRLQADQGSYILHGTVDVLAQMPNNPSTVEIWDYKGQSKPSMNDPLFQRYQYQMQVYAELYRLRTGQAPQRVALYFLNELAGSVVPTTRPVNAVMYVNVDPNAVANAIQNFGNTVQSIEQCRAQGQWPSPVVDPGEKTCDACDLRWNCLAARGFGRNYPLIFP